MIRYLLVLNTPKKVVLPTNGKRFSIGSSATADLVVLGRGVRKLHATIEVRGESAWLINHSLTTKTHLNGSPVSNLSLLANLDTLSIGKTGIQYLESNGNLNYFKPSYQQFRPSVIVLLEPSNAAAMMPEVGNGTDEAISDMHAAQVLHQFESMP